MLKTSLLWGSILLMGWGSPAFSSDAQDGFLLAQADATGILEFRASGEDRAVDGFTTKDGWQLEFEHIFVTLADVTAYQSDPAFDALSEADLEAEVEIGIPESVTVDLAADADEEYSVLVEAVDAPAGRYNALSWRLTPAAAGMSEGYSLMLVGTATRQDETVDFGLKLSSAVTYTCGEFIGDARKGILEAGGTADIQATFHLDHLFGEEGKEASFNDAALGFDPLAAVAEDGQLDADTEALADLLSPEDFTLLTEVVFPELGHVGEGHCRVTDLSI